MSEFFTSLGSYLIQAEAYGFLDFDRGPPPTVPPPVRQGLADTWNQLPPAAQGAMAKLMLDVVPMAPYHAAVNNSRRRGMVKHAAAHWPEGHSQPGPKSYKSPHSFLKVMAMDAAGRAVSRSALGVFNALADQWLTPDMATNATAVTGVTSAMTALPFTNKAQGKDWLAGLKPTFLSEAVFALAFAAVYAPLRNSYGYDIEKRQWQEALVSGAGGGAAAAVATLLPHGCATAEQLVPHFKTLTRDLQAQVALRGGLAQRFLTCIPVGMATAGVRELIRPLGKDSSADAHTSWTKRISEAGTEVIQSEGQLKAEPPPTAGLTRLNQGKYSQPPAPVL